MAMALPAPDTSAPFSRSLLADYDIVDSRYPPATYPSDTPSRPPQNGPSQWSGAPSPTPVDFNRESTLQSSPAPQSASYSAQQNTVTPRRDSRAQDHTFNYDDQAPSPIANAQNLAPNSTLSPVQPPAGTLNPETLGHPSQTLMHSPPVMMASETAPRHPNVPISAVNLPNDQYSKPIIPLSAGPNYTPVVSRAPRAQPKQPTYVNQAPDTANPMFSRPIQEEVCIECSMRDQDMADVDVTSPGIWERESDALYEDLKRWEEEDEVNGIPPSPDRPRSTGHPLSEMNVKIWLSINPREPTSRYRTLTKYVKAQQSLLEKEALAQAQVTHEARRVDDRVRDAYSQLRRSAYDQGTSALPADDTGGVRIRPPQSPAYANHPVPHNRSQSREVTLLENGMIVEHVDVRREEREARDRRKREERRVRKSSKGSTYDVTSVISNQSYAPAATDSGVGLKPSSRYSQASVGRPPSTFTNERPDIPRAYSQASFSDVQSLSSASPRRSRFFGHLGSGWKSQNSLAPSGFSGSMVDMHIALQHSNHQPRNSVFDSTTLRQSSMWSVTENTAPNANGPHSGEQGKKAKKGLAKIWDKMKGGKNHKQDTIASRDTSHTFERTGDDAYLLTPPPPLSYLVRGEPQSRSHASTPSLSAPSPLHKMPGTNLARTSPPTPPSSLLPSPVSSRPPDQWEASTDAQKSFVNGEERYNENSEEPMMRSRSVHPTSSEPDIRGRTSEMSTATPIPPVPVSPLPFSNRRPVTREKSLPPIPSGEGSMKDGRPQTSYMPPMPPFAQDDGRRQSFGGVTLRPDFGQGQGRRPLTNYEEFGDSRYSLGSFGQNTTHRNQMSSPAPSSKRKSKFGLSSLLGKKQTSQTTYSDEGTAQGTHYNGMESNGYSRSSTYYDQGGRASVASRRPLEEVVPQDPDFVAYRYPSSDQRLDLLR